MTHTLARRRALRQDGNADPFFINGMLRCQGGHPLKLFLTENSDRIKYQLVEDKILIVKLLGREPILNGS
jgi:hypothetical protein